MKDFPVRISQQLPALIQAFRKRSGLTQAEVALRLGITQQTMSALERNAGKVSAERLLRLLNILSVELVLRQVDSGADTKAADPQASGPAW